MNSVEYKGYVIEGDKTYGHKVIRSLGKGALHKVLKGSFTNYQFAKSAIDGVVAEKEITNAPSINTD